MGLIRWLKTGRWSAEDHPGRGSGLSGGTSPLDKYEARTPITPRLIRTPKDAEAAAADWMKVWGYWDAVAAGGGPDGGVDVRSSQAVAQVKAQTRPTGRPEVQQLAGVAMHEDVRGFFFSLAGYTEEAVQWGIDAQIALFEFDLQGTPVPVNDMARAVEQRSVPPPDLEQWRTIREEIVRQIREEAEPPPPGANLHSIGDHLSLVWLCLAPSLDPVDAERQIAQFGARKEASERGEGYVPLGAFDSPRVDYLVPETDRFPRAVVQNTSGKSTSGPGYVVGGQVPVVGGREIYVSFDTAEETADWIIEVAQLVGADPCSWGTESEFRARQQREYAELLSGFGHTPKRQPTEEQRWSAVRREIERRIRGLEVSLLPEDENTELTEFRLMAWVGGKVQDGGGYIHVISELAFDPSAIQENYKKAVDMEMLNRGEGLRILDEEMWQSGGRLGLTPHYAMKVEKESPFPSDILTDASRFERYEWTRPDDWPDVLPPKEWGVRGETNDPAAATDWIMDLLVEYDAFLWSVEGSLDL